MRLALFLKLRARSFLSFFFRRRKRDKVRGEEKEVEKQSGKGVEVHARNTQREGNRKRLLQQFEQTAV